MWAFAGGRMPAAPMVSSSRWHRRLTAEGVPCEKAPVYNATYKIYQALFRDPNGYLIEVQRFEDPRWNPETAS